MKFTPNFVILGVMLGHTVNAYDCAVDGLPTAVINARKRADGAAVEFYVPLFSQCLDIANDDHPLVIPGPIAGGTLGILPDSLNSLWVTDVADQDGFTGSDRATRIAQKFPLWSIECVVYPVGGSGHGQGFNISGPVTIGTNGAAALVNFVRCASAEST